MSSMGELTFFLGLQVKQKPNGIFISQDKYVAEILKKFDFASVKTASTPIETQKPLVKDEEASDVDVHLYRSMIGSLMYVTASRPDIMFAVPKGAQPKLGLWYPKRRHFDMESYTDSDYAEQNLVQESTQEVSISRQETHYLAMRKANHCGHFYYRSRICWLLQAAVGNGSSVDERGKTHHGKSNLFQETPKPLCSTFLPTDVKHCLNVGYTFVNFTTSEAVWKSHVCITRKSWPLFKSKKIAQVVRAWIQSKNSLVKHFEDMRLCRPSKEYLPVWFDPPRDESMSCLTTKGMRNNGAMCARVLNSPCFLVKSWLVQDQTVLGKDYSNLLIADSLLKTIWFINAPCYDNEALASPKANSIRAKNFLGEFTPLFDTMLVQPTQDEGASSERLSDEQPSPSPAPTSEVPNESLPDSSSS
ncbi:uncharacterized mitochondrial protein-like protein [Tanacetum coccineum]